MGRVVVFMTLLSGWVPSLLSVPPGSLMLITGGASPRAGVLATKGVKAASAPGRVSPLHTYCKIRRSGSLVHLFSRLAGKAQYAYPFTQGCLAVAVTERWGGGVCWGCVCLKEAALARHVHGGCPYAPDECAHVIPIQAQQQETLSDVPL